LFADYDFYCHFTKLSFFKKLKLTSLLYKISQMDSNIFSKIWSDFEDQYFEILSSFNQPREFDLISVLIKMRYNINSIYNNKTTHSRNGFMLYNTSEGQLSDKVYETVIKLINQTFIALINADFPISEYNADQSVVGKWPEATNQLIEKLSSDYKPIKIIKFKEFFAKLKSFDGTNYNLLVDEISSYKKVYDIWFKLQNPRSNRDNKNNTSDKISPFYTAISQGLPDEVLYAFVECGWDLDEYCYKNNEQTSPFRLAFSLCKFKLFHAMVVKLNSKSDPNIPYGLAFYSISVNFGPNLKAIPIPRKLPLFKTFDNRFDFVHYLHFAMDKCHMQPDVFDLSIRGVLTWYRKYRAAIFNAIICKADHLPRLNKDVIWAISEFIS